MIKINHTCVIFFYHYIIDKINSLTLPYGISLDRLEKHIDLLRRRHEIISLNEYHNILSNNPQAKGNFAILTFDDGTKGHYEAHKLLKTKSVIGTFFISTDTLDENPLFIHKMHILSKSDDNEQIYWELKRILAKELSEEETENVFTFNEKDCDVFGLYNERDKYTKYTKYILYRQIKYMKLREKIINLLFENEFQGENIFDGFYLNSKELSDMNNEGSVIGSHSTDHHNVIYLDKIERIKRFRKAKSVLEHTLNKQVDFFCYPGMGEYDNRLEDISGELMETGHRLGLTGIEETIKNSVNPFALPRIDCNRIEEFCG